MPAAAPGTVVQIGSTLGPGGDTGQTGATGAIGPTGNARTTTQAGFTVPSVGGTVNVQLADASWCVLGQMISVQSAGGNPTTAGSLQVTAINGNQVTLLNPSIPSVALASPSGPGLLGTLSGNVTDYAGGDNACHPFGSLGHYYGSDTTNALAYAVTVGTDFVLTPGVTVWVTPSLSNTGSNPTLNVNATGAIPIVSRANTPLLFAAEIVANQSFGVIYDGTSWRIITPLQRRGQFTNVANPVLECAGFDSVMLYATVTSTLGQGISLQHVSSGVPIVIVINNATAAGNNYSINATTPDGTAFGTVSWVWANSTTTGAAAVNLKSAISQSASSVLMFQGMAVGGTLFLK